MHPVSDSSYMVPQGIPPMNYHPMNAAPLPMGVPPPARMPPPISYGMPPQPMPYGVVPPFTQPIGPGVMMPLPLYQYGLQYPGGVPMPMGSPTPLPTVPTPIPPPKEAAPISIISPPVQNPPTAARSAPPPTVPSDITFAPMPEGDPTLTTVYISSIPEDVGENWMKKILSSCAAVSGWKRLSDSKGYPLNFGFCIYDKIEGFALALKVLYGDTNLDNPNAKGVEIYNSVSKKRESFRLKIDQLAKEALESYLKQADMAQFEEKAKNVSEDVQQVLKDLEESCQNGTHRAVDLLINSAVADSEAMNPRQLAAPSWDALEDTSEEISAERKELIMQEIVTFRQKAAKQIGEGMRECDVVAETKHASDGHRHRETRKRHDSTPLEQTSHYNPREELNEEELRLKKKKRVQEQHQCYLERLALWKKEEESRIGLIKHYAKKEAEDARFLKSRCESLEESLPKWDHDSKITAIEDRLEYWSKCYKRRISEILRDENEAKREKCSTPSSPVSSKREKQPSEGEVRDEAGIILGRIMTKEERLAACQDLRDTIPKDKDGVSNWNVKWDELDEYIIERVLRPFVVEKISEFIGTNDVKDLCQFTMELIQNRTPLDKMITDFQMIFDDDAEEIAVSLFSIIIYETEAKLRGLT